MRILVAPDSFGGTLSAGQAAAAIAAGWRRTAPEDQLDLCPLSDGGPGFLDTLQAGLGGTLLSVTVPSPLREPVPAAVLVVDADGVRTAYIESAQAIGLPLVPLVRRDPTVTTTAGVGRLIQAALDAGANRIVVGLGGSATNDAGAGMLGELGVGPDEALGAGGLHLGAVRPVDLAGLAAVRERLSGVELIGAYDVDVPLLGLQGASGGFAAQKGATAEQAHELERSLGHFAQVVGQSLGSDLGRPDLLVGAPRAPRLATAAGTGAAGGLGFGLAVLGGRLVPGSVVVAGAVGLAERIAAVQLVLTGEGTFDWQSLHGKVVQAVAMRALDAAVPTVVLAGQVTIGRREWGAAGIAGAYAVATSDAEVVASLADPSGTLAARAARLARTWSH